MVYKCKLLISDPIKLEVRRPLDSEGKVLVSVIVPLAQLDGEPKVMLAMLPRTFEIILARGGTRASSMNQAAAIATGQYFWFVHADTTLGADAVSALLDRLSDPSPVLRYFDVRFDGGALMRLTEFGVFIRSRVLKLPFGDQALCIPEAVFGTSAVTTKGWLMAKTICLYAKRVEQEFRFCQLARLSPQARESIARMAGSGRR
jgi:hypothetical protein